MKDIMHAMRKRSGCTYGDTKMRMVTRKKVLIIPYIGQNMEKVLMVSDVKTNEWGFISGGVKKHESSFQAAERELTEETSGIFRNIDVRRSKVDVFYTLYRPPELLKIDKTRNEIVRSMYTVYMYELDEVPPLGQFVSNKEVNDIQMKPYHEFKNVWKFCDYFYNSYLVKQTR